MDEQQLREIFDRITEHYQVPIRIGGRCESRSFYRVDDLTTEELEFCADYVADRITKVCQPQIPTLIVQLPGSYTGLADMLSRSLAPPGDVLEVLLLEKLDPGNGMGKKIKTSNIVMVNDVITTARSCLEAHTKITLMGASVLCWAALVDRTFGPGPVPVVAAFTGEPVTLLEGLS